MTTITVDELLNEDVELLPTRETLAWANWATVNATNAALALNAGALFSQAAANANQAVFVTQL